VLEEHFELRGIDCEDSECVVEFEGILDIQAGNVAGSFVCREIGLGGLQSSVCTGAANGVSDAAAVLERDASGGVILLGIPEVGIGREIAEVGFLLADGGAATFEVNG
jgi:hypothetical protein